MQFKLPSMPFFDAHCHLQDKRLANEPLDRETFATLEIGEAVTNGTSEFDWERVRSLAMDNPRIRPSFGLHPWKAKARSETWLAKLESYLAAPNACVGEIGLDRWIPDHDIEDQKHVFASQLRIAKERNLPVAIHCLKAWGALRQEIDAIGVPERGFLVHSFGGSLETMQALARKGGYFSISGYFFHERKSAQREILKRIPLDRLLLETDAPDMAGPMDLGFALRETEDGQTVSSPSNIAVVYRHAAALFGLDEAALSAQVESNYTLFYGYERAVAD